MKSEAHEEAFLYVCRQFGASLVASMQDASAFHSTGSYRSMRDWFLQQNVGDHIQNQERYFNAWREHHMIEFIDDAKGDIVVGMGLEHSNHIKPLVQHKANIRVLTMEDFITAQDVYNKLVRTKMQRLQDET